MQKKKKKKKKKKKREKTKKKREKIEASGVSACFIYKLLANSLLRLFARFYENRRECSVFLAVLEKLLKGTSAGSSASRVFAGCVCFIIASDDDYNAAFLLV